MKSMEEFCKEIAGSKELQQELKKTSFKEMEEFLREHDCEANVNDFIAYVEAQNEGEIDDEVAKTIAGGIPMF